MEVTSPSTLENYRFVSKRAVTPLPPSSGKAKKLTRAVCKMIARDIRPISIVNDTGFLNLLQEAEPCYVVPCRTTITRSLNELYSGELEEQYQVQTLSAVPQICGHLAVEMFIFPSPTILLPQSLKCATIICKLIIF